MNSEKLFETEHLQLVGKILKESAAADIIFKLDNKIIGTYYLSASASAQFSYDQQENGLSGHVALYGDKFQTYICDYDRYGEFIRCLDEFNDLVLAEKGD